MTSGTTTEPRPVIVGGVDEKKTKPTDLFVSMDREIFARSTCPSPEAYRQALLEPDAALQRTRRYVPVRHGARCRPP